MNEQRAPTANQLATTRRAGVEQYLKNQRVLDQISAVIPPTMAKAYTAERYVRGAMIAVSESEYLQKCEPRSIMTAIVRLATYGLDCSGVSGEAYLVPFKGRCTAMLGYRGMITLALRSGKVLSMQANLVYVNDTFRMNLADNEPPFHEAPWDEDERGELLGGYAVAYLAGGGVVKERMSIKALDKIRASSAGKNLAPWREHKEEMYRKSLLRRLSKRIPLSPDLQEALTMDAEQETEVKQTQRVEVLESQEMDLGELAEEQDARIPTDT